MSQISGNTVSTPRIPVLGIVGGVGSGKSSVAKKLAEKFPVAIIDADRLGHQALELPAVRAQLRRRFGETILDGQGRVIRGNLAALVFGDSPEQQAARADLERITHPEISRLAHEQITQLQADQNVRWIVLDAPLLLEAGWNSLCDAVAFLDVPEDRRIEQVRAQRGWSLEDWRRREASQWPLERKRAAAEFVVSNHQTLEAAAQSLARELDRRFARDQSPDDSVS